MSDSDSEKKGTDVRNRMGEAEKGWLKNQNQNRYVDTTVEWESFLSKESFPSRDNMAEFSTKVD